MVSGWSDQPLTILAYKRHPMDVQRGKLLGSGGAFSHGKRYCGKTILLVIVAQEPSHRPID